MNHDIKFVYLDIVGTLVVEAKTELVIALNIPEGVFKKAFSASRLDMHKGIITPLDFVTNLKNTLHMSPEEAFRKWNHALENLSIIEPMHQLTKDLKVKYKVGLLSNIFVGHFELLNNAGKIPNGPYDAIIRSCDVGFAKPEKEIYKIATQKAKVNFQEILFIDDKKENVDAAISYGWRGFIFDSKNPVKSVNELRKILL